MIDLPEDLRDKIVLEFGHVLQSLCYSRVIELAQHMSTYQRIGEGRNERHFVALTESESEQWFELYEDIQNWKSSRVHYRNLSASPRYLLGIFRCYNSRSKSENAEGHCLRDNWIGCNHIRAGNSLELTYEDGRFLSKTEFEPNKESIKNQVREWSSKYGLCPAFDITRIEEQVDKLPSFINLDEEENWRPIIEPNIEGEGGRLIGIQYYIDHVRKDAPLIEDVDKLGGFSVRSHGFLQEYDEVWEHKIVVLNNDQYQKGAKKGTLSEIAELGQKGWSLVTIVREESEWHFILQRKRPY